MDYISRSPVRKKKRRRDRLMSVAEADPRWATGFEDECWWSRVALPTLSSWAEEGKPTRLIQKSVAKDDPDPKAVTCYGLYLPEFDETWLRFVDGRPVSGITTRFLGWCAEKLEALGKQVLLLIWDNASWHISREARRWLGEHNREVKKSGKGVRIVSCLLPKQSPWLNAIEPKWVHGKRKVVEPEGLLGAYELADRVSVGSFRLSALRASIHSPGGRLIMH
jgi:DDE superfamily endonuclease